MIYFLDGVHPQHNTRSTYVWLKRGEQKIIPTNSGRQRINISGAMNAYHPEEVIIHEGWKQNSSKQLGRKAFMEVFLSESTGGFSRPKNTVAG